MKSLKLADAELGTLAHMLRKVDFFSPLTVGDMEHVLPFVLLQSFEAGETVFSQGDPGDAFYIIETGEVEIWFKKGFFSLSKIVATMGPGDFFGEMALISQEKRTATVACTEPSRLFALVAADFQFVLKKNPAAAAEMERIAARRKFNTSHLSDS